ncbi:MAG: response regulator [Candidatus Latescibacterota bacterium]|nr:response regulator [Candidatus Latescibacterota bacterium]
MQHTILLVDDEENITRSLRRLFHREDYKILTATNGHEGLDMLQQHTVSLIISDHRMPEMLGSEFLVRSRDVAPHAIRMLLTGYADMEAVTKAINQGGISRYIAKPWNDEEIKQAVRNALHVFELERENRRLTDQLLEKNKSLEQFNARLEQAVKERTHELASKIKVLSGKDLITEHMLSLHSLDETLNLVLNVVHKTLEMGAAVVYLISEASTQPAAAIDQRGNALDEDALQSHEISTRHTQAFEQVARSLRPARVGQDRNHSVSPFAIVPILRGDELLGYMEVTSHHRGAPISEEELNVVASFALQAAKAISDAQAHSDLDTWKSEVAAALKDWDL